MKREEYARELIQTRLDIKDLIDAIEEVEIYSIKGAKVRDRVLDILYGTLEV